MSTAPGLYRRGQVWWLRYSYGGKQIRRSCQTTKKKEAEALLGKLKAELFEGRHFPDKRTAELTVLDLRDKWLARAKHKATAHDDVARFARIVDFFGADRPVADLTTEDVDEFRDALLEEPVQHRVSKKPPQPRAKKAKRPTAPKKTLSVATVNRHLALLRSALRHADKLGYVTRRPQVRLLEERNSRADRVCSDEELDLLLTEASGELRLAIILARYSGMRLGELMGLTWDRLDLRRGLAKLGVKDTKTREARLVPLGTPAVEALKAWPRRLGEPKVFKLKAASISPYFSRLAASVGIEDLHFHDLRGTRLTELRRAGADLKQIQAISGHKTLAILVERYQAISTEELLEVARKAERRGKEP